MYKTACKKFKYDDSHIRINKKFLQVDQIFIDYNDKLYIVGRKLETTKLYDNMFKFRYTSNKLLVKLNDTIRMCVRVKINDDNCETNYLFAVKIRSVSKISYPHTFALYACICDGFSCSDHSMLCVWLSAFVCLLVCAVQILRFQNVAY